MFYKIVSNLTPMISGSVWSCRIGKRTQVVPFHPVYDALSLKPDQNTTIEGVHIAGLTRNSLLRAAYITRKSGPFNVTIDFTGISFVKCTFDEDSWRILLKMARRLTLKIDFFSPQFSGAAGGGTNQSPLPPITTQSASTQTETVTVSDASTMTPQGASVSGSTQTEATSSRERFTQTTPTKGASVSRSTQTEATNSEDSSDWEDTESISGSSSRTGSPASTPVRQKKQDTLYASLKDRLEKSNFGKDITDVVLPSKGITVEEYVELFRLANERELKHNWWKQNNFLGGLPFKDIQRMAIDRQVKIGMTFQNGMRPQECVAYAFDNGLPFLEKIEFFRNAKKISCVNYGLPSYVGVAVTDSDLKQWVTVVPEGTDLSNAAIFQSPISGQTVSQMDQVMESLKLAQDKGVMVNVRCMYALNNSRLKSLYEHCKKKNKPLLLHGAKLESGGLPFPLKVPGAKLQSVRIPNYTMRFFDNNLAPVQAPSTFTLELPPWSTENLDSHLNHLNNPRAGSMLTFLHNLPECMREIKIQNFKRILESLEDAECRSVSAPLLDILCHYIDNSEIFGLLRNKLAHIEFERVSKAKMESPSVEYVNFLVACLQEKTPLCDEPLTSVGLYQILYHAHSFAIDVHGIQSRYDRENQNLAEKMRVLGLESNDYFYFVTPTIAMLVPVVQYQGWFYGESWQFPLSTTCVFEKNNSGDWVSVNVREMSQLCERERKEKSRILEFFPLIDWMEEERKNIPLREKLVRTLCIKHSDFFDFESKFFTLFTQALRSSAVFTKITDLESLEYKYLQAVMEELTETVDGELRLKLEYLNSFNEILSQNNLDGEEKKIVGLVFSLMLMTLTSTRFWGEEGISPEPLRGIASAFAYQAKVDGLLNEEEYLDLRNSLQGLHNAFNCTAVLGRRVGALLVSKCRENQNLQKIVNALLPCTWGGLS